MPTDNYLPEPDELLQTVDWNSGLKTGKHFGRHICHEQGIPHVSANLWLTTVSNNVTYIYFQKRAPTKINFPEKFDAFVAGHLTGDETPEECLIREAKEEIQLNIAETELHFFLKRRYFLQLKNYLDMEWIFHYIMHLEKYEPFTSVFTDREVIGLAQFKFEDILGLFAGEKTGVGANYFDGIKMTDVKLTKQDFSAFCADADFWNRFSESTKCLFDYPLRQ